MTKKNRFREQKAILFFALPLIVLAVFFLPFIVLGLGQAFDYLTPWNSAHQAERYLEEKYKEEFEVAWMKESNLNGVYEGKAYAEDSNLTLNLSGWKSSHSRQLYIQDDYTLQLLINELVQENFDFRPTLVKVSYAYPLMFTDIIGGKTDWTKLLEEREQKLGLSIYLEVFISEKLDSNVQQSAENLKSKIEKENLEILSFGVGQLPKENMKTKIFLSDKSKKKLKVTDYFYVTNQ